MSTIVVASLCSLLVGGDAPPLPVQPPSAARAAASGAQDVAPAAVREEPNGLALDATLAIHGLYSIDEPDGVEQQGVRLTDALFAFEGRFHGYDASLAFDLDETSGTRLDRAWVQGELDVRHDVRVGLLRRPFLWSAFADESAFVFPQRSRLGREFGESDEGVELLADYRVVDVRVALTNGADGTSDAREGTARLGVHLFGERPVAGERPIGPEGASLYLAYTDEGALAQGDAFAAELHTQLGHQRVHLEWLDAAEGLGDQRGGTATYAFGFDGGESELALRLEHLREPQRHTVLGIGYGQSFLRDTVRGQVAAEWVDGSGSAFDGWLLSAGLVLSL